VLHRRSRVFARAVPTVVAVALASFAVPALAVTPALGSRTLREGMRGADVRALQRDLTNAGFKVAASGIFGPVTLREVRAFQRQFALKVDGIVDTAFLHEMQIVLFPGAGSATSGILGQRTLQQGMRGSDVRALQRELSTTGYPTAVDGSFGAATRRSVEYFQQDNGIRANGVVTYQESLVLRELVAIVRVGGHNRGLGNGTVAAPPAPPTGPGGASGTATITSNGTAMAPANAPNQVQQVIAAANQIIGTPYVWGGGHGSWQSDGYDCSGAVSFALHGGGLLSSPEDSTALESYGDPGPGRWITIYADAAHAFMVVAGRAFDTADYGGPNIPAGSGPRWRSNPTGNLADGGEYIVRHPPGL
jgi:peptidoglycan hydrolase-like protein with peptidoglycan-binding domain